MVVDVLQFHYNGHNQHNYRYFFVPTDIHSHFNFKTSNHIIVTTIFQGDV